MNIISNLGQQRQKSTVQNKMIDIIVYYLFNSLGISGQICRLILLE